MAKEKTNKKLKNFTICIYVELIAAVLFSLFSVSFHADISLLALPVSLIYCALAFYITYFKMLRKTDGSIVYGVSRLLQYLPIVDFIAFILRRAGKFGTAYWYDVISVLLWCVIFISSLFITYYMNDKRIGSFTSSWKIKPVKSKLFYKARIAFEIIDWIDALVQAVFMVLLIQIFVLQLYVIPSESMVPTFLIKDRVAVTKINCGPKFPLTDVGFPDLADYNRGDIVVLRNPHYKIDRKSEVKSVTSQLVYMLTFMAVNLNKDENGQPKADPLVKRITGIAGEQLVMQDGVLYSRTKNNDVFAPVKQDETYACWDLSKVKKSIMPRIQSYPLSMIDFNDRKSNLNAVVTSASKQYDEMLKLEEKRRNLDLDIAAFQTKELVRKLKTLVYNDNLMGSFTIPSLDEYDLFVNIQDITGKMMNQKGGIDWFETFMTSWIDSKNNSRDIYSEANFKLNVMTKICFGNIVLRYAELVRNGFASKSVADDEVLLENMQEASLLDWYIRGLLDSRNMPVFPPNDENGNPQYIPDNCYFMMGDNRFNSLDLRHGNDFKNMPLSKEDPYSVEYDSIMEPQYVNKKLILGKPLFRFWPLDRPMKLK